MRDGRLPPTTIENTMQDFVDGKFDVLLSTTIVESGLDIPSANTIIVHEADHFGLAVLGNQHLGGCNARLAGIDQRAHGNGGQLAGKVRIGQDQIG